MARAASAVATKAMSFWLPSMRLCTTWYHRRTAMTRHHLIALLLVTACGGSEPTPPNTQNPILFVTQVPWDGFASVSAPFGNHSGDVDAIPRGGDLWIRYGDGTLRNLTEEAGYGSAGMQGANAIAVRDPTVHWDGQKAVFAMVVGSP